MLVLLSGVSGAGKDTVKKEILKKVSNATTMPSYTTRSPREGEVDGEIYNFITKEEFKKKIEEGEFYEYSLHHDNYYGTSKKILNGKLQEGKVIVKDIEVNGTENLLRLLKDDIKMITIFLKVPRKELESRLINRDDKMTKEELELRLSRLEYEESKIPMYDYVIDNYELDKTVEEIIEIIKKEQ